MTVQGGSPSADGLVIRVTYSSGESVDLTVTPRARRNFEAEFKMPLTKRMRSGFSDWGDYLAHQVAVQRHGEERELEEWIDDVDVIGLVINDPPPGDSEDSGDGESDTPTGGATTQRRGKSRS